MIGTALGMADDNMAGAGSFSISAETSPVWAPDGLGWQSCAPILMCWPAAAAAKREISVNGGQISTSAWPASPAADAGRDGVEFVYPLGETVHLPVARNEGARPGCCHLDHPCLLIFAP